MHNRTRNRSRGRAAAWQAAGVAILLAVNACAQERNALSALYLEALGDLEYVLEPAKGAADAPRPLCVVLAGGTGDETMARTVMASVGTEMVKRGWVVAAPIEGDGESFLGWKGRLVPKLIEKLQSRPDITDDPVVAVGVSNGGIAALEIAADEPKLFSAVVAVPGVVSQRTRVERLKGMPVYLRVGEDDHLRWGQSFPEAERRLRQAGVRLDAKCLPGVGHNVAINWNEVDAWLERELGAKLPVPRLTRPPASPPPSGALAPRTWTSRDGRSVQAVLVRVDGEMVLLRLASGAPARIRFSQLSAADQAYLRGMASGRR